MLFATTTEFGGALLCKRAAKFRVSPKTLCSCADPSPVVGRAITTPVAMPTRTCSGSLNGSRS